MDIQKQQLNSDFSKELITLVRSKYAGHKNLDYFLKGYEKALVFCIGNSNVSVTTISAYKEKSLIANISLILDKRLPKGEALFGFFEMPNEISICNTLWNELIAEAHANHIATLKGPINGSIWHQYRCIKETDGSDFFKSEPCTEEYYYEFLQSVHPTSEIVYHSGYREKFDAILAAGQAAYNKLEPLGFLVRKMDTGSVEQLQQVAQISRIVFKDSWGFVELNESEFTHLYSSDTLSSSASTVYLLYHGKIIIGFCGVFEEDASTLICKTIAVLPEYQGTGLGNALAFQVHVDAHDGGYKKIIYALVREDNNIKHFPKEDAVIFRRYAGFEYKINQHD